MWKEYNIEILAVFRKESKTTMNPETETASLATGINGVDGSDATITCTSETSELIASNGG